jgi:hypothetical protein
MTVLVLVGWWLLPAAWSLWLELLLLALWSLPAAWSLALELLWSLSLALWSVPKWWSSQGLPQSSAQPLWLAQPSRPPQPQPQWGYRCSLRMPEDMSAGPV